MFNIEREKEAMKKYFRKNIHCKSQVMVSFEVHLQVCGFRVLLKRDPVTDTFL